MAKHPFDYHRPSEAQVEQITTVRDGCKALHTTLLALPNSRERSLAITKLEEVSMWANKSVIMADEGEVEESLAWGPENTRVAGLVREPGGEWRQPTAEEEAAHYA